MNYKPILFSSPMVRAILEGRKTQTRRITRDNGDTLIGYEFVENSPTWPEKWKGKASEPYTGWVAKFSNLPIAMPRTCPYGVVGDVLWVREEHYRYGQWRKNGHTKTGRQKWKFYPDPLFPEIRFHENTPAVVEKNSHRATGWYKRLARFMPKSAARIWLEITGIRVERLQEISKEDANSEGRQKHRSGAKCMTSAKIDYDTYMSGAIPWFKALWESINGPESWEANPWVWVVSFKVLSTTGKPDNI